MIFIQDSGSVFEAPLETVWKLAEDHVEHGNKIHPDTRNNKAEIIDETSFINSWEQDDENGQTIRMKIKGFISSIILNVEVTSALSSTTRIFLGLWTMLLLLLIKSLGFQTPN
jgi:hypothetical protein